MLLLTNLEIGLMNISGVCISPRCRRKSSYNLLYPKFSGDLENFPSQNSSEDHTFSQFSPKLNSPDSHGQKLFSVVDNTSSLMYGADFQETEIHTGKLVFYL